MSVDPNAFVPVQVAFLEELLDDRQFLQALRSSGVTDWEGYSKAVLLLKDWKEQP